MAWNDWTKWDTAAQIGGALGTSLENAATSLTNTAQTLTQQASTSAGRAELMRSIWQQMDTLTASAIADLNRVNPATLDTKILASVNTMRQELAKAENFLQSANRTAAIAQNLEGLGKNLGAIVGAAEILYKLNNPNLTTYDFGETGAGFIGGAIGAGIAAALGATAVGAALGGIGLGLGAKYLWENFIAPQLDWSEGNSPLFWDNLFDSLGLRPTSGGIDGNEDYNNAIGWRPPVDPLMLDLDGDGLELTRVNGEILFDHDGDGIKTGTGWLVPDDGILVRDTNGDGRITSGKELFGEHTIKGNGQKAINGFDALGDLDSNGDGNFTSADVTWNQVKIWRDMNQNGLSDEGELFSLDELGISRIGVNGSATNETGGNQAGTTVNGNFIAQSATYTRNGQDLTVAAAEMTAGSVDLETDNFHREFTTSIPWTEQAKVLPDMRGSGRVRDLREAVSLSAELAQTLTAFSQANTRDSQMGLIDKLITDWARSSDFWSKIENNLAVNNTANLTITLPGGFEESNFRNLIGVLEVFNGERFYHTSGTRVSGLITSQSGDQSGSSYWITPPAAQLQLLQQSYESLKQSIYGALTLQTRLKPYLDSISVIINEDGLGFDTTELTTKLNTYININASEAIKDLLDLSKYGQSTLQAVGFNSFEVLASWQESSDPIVKAALDSLDVLSASITTGSIRSDIYVGNAESNSFKAGIGDDILYGAEGNDFLDGGTGNDTYYFEKGWGQDIIDNYDVSAGRKDVISFGTGIATSDIVVTRSGADLLLLLKGSNDKITVSKYLSGDGAGGYAVDEIRFADGSVWDISAIKAMLLQGSEGDDTLYGYASNDVLRGRLGNDMLNGGGGSDTYIYNLGDGNDTITEAYTFTTAIDKLVLGQGITASNIVIGRSGKNISLTFSDGGAVNLIGEDDTADAGIEQIVFSDGLVWSKKDLMNAYLLQQHTAGATTIAGFDQNNDVITGTDGNDTLSGGAGDDIFTGRSGNDAINGGAGSDTYFYNLGDGNDTITEAYTFTTFIDKLVLGQGITASNIVIGHSGKNISLTFSDGGSVNLIGEDDTADAGIEQIVFADGLVWSKKDLMNAYLLQQHTAGATTIAGFDQNNDVITGTDGNDTLSGGAGDDIFTGRSGNDAINGGAGSDTYFYNLGDGNDTITEAYTFTTFIDKLVLGQGITASNIVIGHSGKNISLTFSDGGSVNLIGEDDTADAGIEQIVFADGLVWSKKDLMNAYLLQQHTAGATTIAGFDQNNDVITGTDGNDTLSGGAGDDIFTGRSGNDAINGGAGSDTYFYNLGDGNDTITEAYTFTTFIDKLVLGQGITASNIVIGHSGKNISLTFSDGGSVNLIGEDDTADAGIEQIVFADGLVWSKKDLMNAYLLQQHTAGATTIAGFDQNNDVITGTDGNDTLSGGAGDDIFTGRSGNDAINGGAGSDTYFYNLGDGNDTIIDNGAYDNAVDKLVLLNIDPSKVSLTRNGDDVSLIIAESIQGSGDAGNILLKGQLASSGGQGLEEIQFADGTIWKPADIRAKLISVAGTSGNDVITGTIYSDLISGGLGDDTLNGGGGADTYIYNLGDGKDTITDAASYDNTVDKLLLGAGITTSNIVIGHSGQNISLTFSDGGAVNLINEDSTNGAGIEQVVFADGLVWSRQDLMQAYLLQQEAAGATVITGFDVTHDVLRGTAGNDTLSGGGGNDTLTGGKGNDALNGGAGADAYFYNLGDGNDTITDVASYDNTVDKLVLGAGITTSSIVIGHSGQNISLTFSDGGAVNLINEDSTNGAGIEQVVFADGLVWSRQDLMQAYLLQQEAAGATVITGFDATHDVLRGTAGNDTLSGGGGNDTLTGGKGNDALNGGAGADAYFYNLGDGNDTITDVASYDNTVDKLVLGAGITTSNIVIGHSGQNISLTFSDGGAVNLINEDSTNGAGIEQVVFADGLVWSRQDLMQAYLLQQEAAGATVITGFDVTHDVLRGTAGNDTLSGGGGNDTLTGGKGNDALNGGAGADAYFYNLGDGNDTITDVASYDNTVDKLVLGAGITTSSIVIGHSGQNISLTFSDGGAVNLINEDSTNGAGIEQVVFADGLVWSRQDLMQAYLLQQEAAGATVITGFDATHDVLRGTAGNDTLSGGGGNDTLTGGKGNDALNGGAGADAYFYNLGDGNDTITDVASYDNTVDKLVLGAGITTSSIVIGHSGQNISLTFSDGGAVNLINEDSTNGAGIEQVVFADGLVWSRQDLMQAYLLQQEAAGATVITGFDATHDVLRGTAGNDTLSGGGGNDSLTGSLGNDVLSGGAGSDIYSFERNFGIDTINDYDASGGKDIAQFAADIASDQLWFRRNGNSLEVSVIGSSEQISISSWYSSASYQVEQFKAGDGKILSNTKVQALVDAMASFAPPAAGQSVLSPDYKNSLDAVISSSWK